jgi:hypothetical protein
MRGGGADAFAGPGLWQSGELFAVGLAAGVGLGVGDESALGVALADANDEAVGDAAAPGWPPQALSKTTPRIGPAVRDPSRRIINTTQLPDAGFAVAICSRLANESAHNL